MKKTGTFLTWSILTIASSFDALSYKIPNQLVVLGYLAGICFNLHSFGMIGIAIFMQKALISAIIFSLPYLIGNGLGSGDIKLLSIVAALAGIRQSIDVFVLSVFLAFAAIVTVSMYEKRLMKRNLHYSFYITAAFFLLQYR